MLIKKCMKELLLVNGLNKKRYITIPLFVVEDGGLPTLSPKLLTDLGRIFPPKIFIHKKCSLVKIDWTYVKSNQGANWNCPLRGATIACYTPQNYKNFLNNK